LSGVGFEIENPNVTNLIGQTEGLRRLMDSIQDGAERERVRMIISFMLGMIVGASFYAVEAARLAIKELIKSNPELQDSLKRFAERLGVSGIGVTRREEVAGEGETVEGEEVPTSFTVTWNLLPNKAPEEKGEGEGEKEQLYKDLWDAVAKLLVKRLVEKTK